MNPVLSYYPLQFDTLTLLVAVHGGSAVQYNAQRIEITDVQNNNNKCWIDVSATPAKQSNPIERFEYLVNRSPSLISNSKEHGFNIEMPPMADNSYYLVPFPCPSMPILGPTTLRVEWICNGARVQLGDLQLGFKGLPPLTIEERRALLASPHVIGKVKIAIKCKECGECFEAIAYLDEEARARDDSGKMLPLLSSMDDYWCCKCKNINADVSIFKRSAEAVFRNQIRTQGDSYTSLAPAYQHSRLLGMVNEFREIVATARREEDVQKFIESNPIVWSFLTPKKILHKPSILTKYKADFAILSYDKTLHFVEIEKPSTRLFRKTGGRHSDVQQPFNQISDWKITVENHRQAVLDEINIKREDVSAIRYIVVAGTEPDAASMIRRDAPTDTTFLSFGDLCGYLSVIHFQVSRL